MFTLDVYFTVHFTIRFSSPFAVSWFMVLQILSACPAQSMDLEKNLPGDSPCPCCCSVYNCPYLWVKLQFLPNSDKLVSYFPVLTLLFWGMGGSGSQKKTRANKCDAKGWPQLPSDWLLPCLDRWLLRTPGMMWDRKTCTPSTVLPCWQDAIPGHGASPVAVEMVSDHRRWLVPACPVP